MSLKDTPLAYGTVSRVLHWGMALLFAWQFTGMALKLALGRMPLVSFFVGTHASVGSLLLLLVLLRAVWALVQRPQRPPHQSGFVGQLALLGHLGLYLLMIVVPALALLRGFGSGKGVRLFGVQLQQPTGVETGWMVAPGNLLHGNLGWVLLALIAGHVAMVAVHRYLWRDDVASRMIGTRQPA